MRQYRGLTKEGKWVYGWYAAVEEKHFIITNESRLDYEEDYNVLFRGIIEVIPETVGQQVGLKDKNGTEIYEGDIIEFTTFDHNGIDYQHKGEVRWSEEDYCWMCGEVYFWCAAKDDEIEIIGNIQQEQDNA